MKEIILIQMCLAYLYVFIIKLCISYKTKYLF